MTNQLPAGRRPTRDPGPDQHPLSRPAGRGTATPERSVAVLPPAA